MVITVFIKKQTTNIALNCQYLSSNCHLWGRTESDMTEVIQQQQQIKRSPCKCTGAFQVALVLKNPLANAGDVRDVCLIPGSRRSPGGRNGNPLQYSCLENPMDTLCDPMDCSLPGSSLHVTWFQKKDDIYSSIMKMYYFIDRYIFLCRFKQI